MFVRTVDTRYTTKMPLREDGTRSRLDVSIGLAGGCGNLGLDLAQEKPYLAAGVANVTVFPCLIASVVVLSRKSRIKTLFGLTFLFQVYLPAELRQKFHGLTILYRIGKSLQKEVWH